MSRRWSRMSARLVVMVTNSALATLMSKPVASNRLMIPLMQHDPFFPIGDALVDGDELGVI